MSTLDDRLARALLNASATVATAESCTAGMVASRLADRPGSSAYLVGGFVTYANEAKTSQVGVSADLLARVGAVSEEVARAMAAGARARLDTTYGVSTTGVAGPGGGTPEKPVGLVHIAVASASTTWHRRLELPGDRDAVRRGATEQALELLLEAVTAGTA
ncbi:nicotinamide-nucleotide amidohydrolase family protein [Nocardioides sp. AE5]|uniref:CinA family protein n=1 Tax=Nocardioides sp. AE5 TaxID=2962573 RepID=UPI00288296D1|nr:nicotinamide-nucleotide amidohydrolase family protein [Nocardioides sp. AE5]MDT0203521.1 nicotinamide-nucleotide amidohydrolase family protein [Nocardioides sp. AE5]